VKQLGIALICMVGLRLLILVLIQEVAQKDLGITLICMVGLRNRSRPYLQGGSIEGMQTTDDPSEAVP